MSSRSILAETSLVGITAMIVYYFIATTHAPVLNHDILMGDLLAFSVILGVLLLDLMDMVEQRVTGHHSLRTAGRRKISGRRRS